MKKKPARSKSAKTAAKTAAIKKNTAARKLGSKKAVKKTMAKKTSSAVKASVKGKSSDVRLAPGKPASSLASKKNITKSSRPVKTRAKESTGFPGYPLYAAADDIMNRSSRVDADLDQQKGAPKIAPYQPAIDTEEDERELSSRPVKRANDDSEVTGDDLEALGTPDLESDGGDDEDLKKRTTPVDFAGADLDVPGSDDDDRQESVGSEDEENNSYSLGGDDHNDLEEDKA